MTVSRALDQTAPPAVDRVAQTQAPVADFDALVHATGRQLHRAALLLTGGDHHLAEDLLQTTYAKVYAGWGRVSRAENPVAYTRTVLTRTFLSHRRLRRSGETPYDDVGDREPAGPRPGGSDPALTLDLVTALRRLGARDRAVVVLRYWLDRSVAETAAELGLSETAVRTASRRALARLRTHLTDLDLDDQDLP